VQYLNLGPMSMGIIFGDQRWNGSQSIIINRMFPHL
jgi:hypothetical protein